MDKIMMMMCQKALIEKQNKEKLKTFSESDRHIPDEVNHVTTNITEQSRNIQKDTISEQTND